MSDREFYRTTYKIVVLSEHPVKDFLSLESIAYEITEGDCSGQLTTESAETLDGPSMATALINQGSEPEFFQLDDTGDDLS